VLKIAGATSTFGTPRGAGRHSVRREDVKRLKDRERQNATRKRFLADAELERVTRSTCWGSASSSPAGSLRAWRRHYAKDHLRRGFGPRITTPAQKAGQSIMRQFNAFGARAGIECPSAAGARASAASPPGRSRTDPYSVTPLRAAGASRCA
jgi:hypothetical protein